MGRKKRGNQEGDGECRGGKAWVRGLRSAAGSGAREQVSSRGDRARQGMPVEVTNGSQN